MERLRAQVAQGAQTAAAMASENQLLKSQLAFLTELLRANLPSLRVPDLTARAGASLLAVACLSVLLLPLLLMLPLPVRRNVLPLPSSSSEPMLMPPPPPSAFHSRFKLRAGKNDCMIHGAIRIKYWSPFEAR